ncbi:arginine biosynthesis bifunctional protein ArgJ [Planctomycetota bacterium]|nr:arginine biosynthesis bifunctional protein ArgJ [Planctomycetota bacterium]
MSSTDLRFASRDQHRSWLASQARLPGGFRVGSSVFGFTPFELDKPAKMKLTIIACDRPTADFAAVFTRNAFPGAPVLVGKRRIEEPTLGAIVINNKISNVCAPDGVQASERVCAAAAGLLNLDPGQILPCSTGVIGWRLPVDAMVAHLPAALATLQSASVLPAAEGICTTDLFPKVRRAELFGGSIVGIAKGAGMIEPNLATMLVYLLTDLQVPRNRMRPLLRTTADDTFNRMSIDSDTSTSDTVALVSSGQVPCPEINAFHAALTQVCADLTEDIVRNGEGVHHVIRVKVNGAPNRHIAERIGKAIVNSPLFQCAVCGNDPNVGRLVMAVGKEIGAGSTKLDSSRLRLSLGGLEIFSGGAFRLDRDKETALVRHLRDAELYQSVVPADGVTFKPPVDYPPHERCVEVGVDLDLGNGQAVILGADRSHEYISENADYRS